MGDKLQLKLYIFLAVTLRRPIINFTVYYLLKYVVFYFNDSMSLRPMNCLMASSNRGCM